MYAAITAWLARVFTAWTPQRADFEALAALAKADIERLLARNERLMDRMDAHEKASAETHARLREEIAAMRGELAECERKHLDGVARVKTLEAEAAAMRSEGARKSRRINELQDQNTRQQAEIDALKQSLAARP